jgi:hypothetical protein
MSESTKHTKLCCIISVVALVFSLIAYKKCCDMSKNTTPVNPTPTPAKMMAKKNMNRSKMMKMPMTKLKGTRESCEDVSCPTAMFPDCINARTEDDLMKCRAAKDACMQANADSIGACMQQQCAGLSGASYEYCMELR